MSDEGNTTEPTKTSPPQKDPSVAELADKLAAAQTKLQTVQSERDKFLEETQNLKTANEQLNSQLGDVKSQLSQVETQLKSKSGELTNWETQHSQLNSQLGEAQTELTQAQRELNLYKQIAETPEYRPLIGMVNGIKVVDDPDQQKTILDAMANGMKETVDNSISMFRAGGTPQGGASGKKQAETGPKSLEEAHAKLQEIDPRVNPQEFRQLQHYIFNAQNGQQTPA